MQGIYTYIPETNHVPKEYSVSAILSLLFMVSISLVPAFALLYFYVRTFRSMCAVPNMAVFCSSFTSWFPGMLLMYFLNDFEMVPVTPIIIGITLILLLLLLLLLLSSSSSSSSSSSQLSPLCTVFTILYLKQTMFLRYTVLQLFCIYKLCYM